MWLLLHKPYGECIAISHDLQQINTSQLVAHIDLESTSCIGGDLFHHLSHCIEHANFPDAFSRNVKQTIGGIGKEANFAFIFANAVILEISDKVSVILHYKGTWVIGVAIAPLREVMAAFIRNSLKDGRVAINV